MRAAQVPGSSAELTDPAPLDPGLWLVSTPIGAARDITLRALDVLGQAQVLAAEDTRSLRHLMQIHGISPGGRPVLAYHDHNGARMRPRLLAELAAGRSVAYASEAGTPLVADPGYQLVRAAVAAGHPVHAVPGASAVLAALAVAGLPTDRFAFMGFPPAQAGLRKTWLAEIAAIPATCVFYESPRRVARLLAEMAPVFGADRPAAVSLSDACCHSQVIVSIGHKDRGYDAEIAGNPVNELVVSVNGLPCIIDQVAADHPDISVHLLKVDIHGAYVAVKFRHQVFLDNVFRHLPAAVYHH